MADETNDEEVFYQITGKGLHSIGAIDHNALRHFQRIEEERENWREIADAANTAADLMYQALLSIVQADSIEEAYVIANRVLGSVSKSDGEDELDG